MTLKELVSRRDEINFEMIEADNREYNYLVEELEWIEQQIEELEATGEETIENEYEEEIH